jgi:hypothetical protein
MIAPAPPIKVPRGEPREIELHLEEDPGSPAPTLTFTLAVARDSATKLYTTTVDHEIGDPQTYRFYLSPTETNRAIGRYWWDVWRLDINQLMAIGSIDIEAGVRLP